MGCSALTKISAASDAYPYNKVRNDFHEDHFLGEKISQRRSWQVRVATKVEDDANFRSTRDVAVKIIALKNTHGSDVDEDRLARAQREVRVWESIPSHANCTRIENVFFGPDICFIVMEGCKANLLQQLNRMQNLNEQSLSRIILQMLHGIDHIHTAKLVHRDIRPDSFYTGGENGSVVKLCDFGRSVALPREGVLFEVVGSAPYQCPEMLSGIGYNEKADIWSLAVFTHAMLFGDAPYAPDSKSRESKRSVAEVNPQPEFVQPAFLQKHRYSDSIVEFAEALLKLDADHRPSASDALSMKYMSDAANDTSEPLGYDLPSLRKALQTAISSGVFNIPSIDNNTSIDTMLRQSQVARHGSAQLPHFRDSKVPGGDEGGLNTKFPASLTLLSRSRHSSDETQKISMREFLAIAAVSTTDSKDRDL
jgi:serine/threonine protein kinase|mmetsp:Transcript_38979/g.62392  ORF Transcript_38979/g.62392 Transcript_38979/m.62392 type:complete len:423 (-) Transcript_38979:267-1535(-)|eukprot:CAMPEP_0169096074 /NCGR_PEP_ID=MMETSP1015-20121227/18808_1 /TAXON_ID=342587 /ORGANISM="Karlodinium micrum, Strain CCMP2283" /LENGTH=422 /DNA_ID=CAMNT_0009156821 /DNA_START=45 /DNA_END=1313 /DNA_ORIENTATION=-